MRRTIIRLLSVAAVAALACNVSIAKDYQCREMNGCVAQKVINGVLQTVSFRKGDLISTQDGWVVDSSLGWKKIKSKPRGRVPQ